MYIFNNFYTSGITIYTIYSNIVYIKLILSGITISLMSFLPLSLPRVLPGTEEFRENREVELDRRLRYEGKQSGNK